MCLKKIIYPFLWLAVLAPVCSMAQTRRIDSLKKQLQVLPPGKEKLGTLLSLCREQSSLSPDTLYQYAISARMLALSEKDTIKAALADYYTGVQYLVRGLTDSSLAIANRHLEHLHYTATEKEVYVNYNLLKARTLGNLNKAKEALNLLYPLLIEAEKQEDTLTQIRTMNGMEAAFVIMDDDKEAQKWCYKALQLYPQPVPAAYEEPLGITFGNTSLTFLHLYESTGTKSLLDSAEYYTSKAITVNNTNEFLGGLAYMLGLKGTMLGFNNKNAEGELLLKESLSTFRRIGNMFYTINAMSVMGNFYVITKQPQKGIAICKEGIELNQKFQPNLYLYRNLAESYRLAGNYKLFGETMQKLSSLKDSLHQKNSAAALSEVQTRYEMQKKENTIIQQNYALAKKNYLAYGSLALLLVGSVFSIILFRENKKKQQLKLQMLKEEEKLRSEIAVNTAEENERSRIAAELHDNLGGQLSYISSNMDFILEAPLLLTEEEKKKHLTKVNETAKSTIADLRESIWALKKQQVEIDELADKLKLFAQNHLAPYTSMQLEVKENIAGKTIISSAEALHVFRIFQEAINNSLKYSRASTIILSIETAPGILYKISLHDNGNGFDTLATYSDHYGLENMRERAKDIHAALEIKSGPGKGTLVSVEKKEI